MYITLNNLVCNELVMLLGASLNVMSHDFITEYPLCPSPMFPFLHATCSPPPPPLLPLPLQHNHPTPPQLKEGFAKELRVRLEEAQAEERERLTLEAQEELSHLRTELQAQLEEQRRALEGELATERERLRALQASLEGGENPQLLALKQRLQAQHDGELRTARSTMAAEVKELNALLLEQSEDRLRDTHDRSAPRGVRVRTG